MIRRTMRFYNNALKQKARKLRKQGFSYGQIGRLISISKSTAKYWCGDVTLTKADRERLYTKQIQMLSQGPQSSRHRRQLEVHKIIREAEEEISFPNNDAYKLFGAALYWAEGNKVNDFTITNSDPLLIKFMTEWFCNMFNITPTHLKAHLNIYPQQDEQEIKKFWSGITKIPIENFGKSFIKPLNKRYKKNTLYYGTIKVRVYKGTNFRFKTFGWVNAMLKNMELDVDLAKQKWYKLKEYSRP